MSLVVWLFALPILVNNVPQKAHVIGYSDRSLPIPYYCWTTQKVWGPQLLCRQRVSMVGECNYQKEIQIQEVFRFS